MKAVLVSVRPKWCKLIFEFLGYDNRRPLYKKRLELRKSAPKETPFRGYIYCTKDNTDLVPSRIWWKKDKTGFEHILNGMVVGEFVCDYVVRHCETENAYLAEEMSCVPRRDILNYSKGKEVFGWHISDLVIYDKPKELREFRRYPRTEHCGFGECELCQHGDYDQLDDEWFCRNYIARAPQSWCYVED